ncbi:MAG: ribonuclease [Aliidongia sp.]|nr:ribonuclease [Aliidongia sp.]
MARRMLIDATHSEETRVVVLNGTRLEEFDFETSTKKQIKGNIYLAKITRVEPSLQAAFVEYGGNRHGFLAFSEIHPDYYRIPVGDREALMAEEFAAHDDEDHGDNGHPVIDNQPDFDHHVAFDADDGHHGDDEPHPAADYAVVETVAVAADGEIAEGDAPISSVVELHDEPVPVETVGGDELEEAQARPRVRHYRNYKIQEVIKRRQILLIQVTKEERGNKGAALTTYLSLAGRYCVLMPNAPRGGGVSRKITSLVDRRRLKELMEELEVPTGMGIIVRTAGSERSKAEIKRDYEYLLRLWDDIRELTLRSSAPTLIYEEGNLIKRAIRDLYSRDMEEILVEGADGFRTAREFMRMLMPSHSPRVKAYRDPAIPLLHRFQVDSQIDQIHNPVVQLRSGGYIVINPTEALVSIDVNSGRATKERNIEETATKTNLEAAEEIARQLRLRDLAGLVVIDFIDMEESRNQKAVEGRLKDAMKIDRARIQLGRISAFGLLELSRQRLRSSLIEASTLPCPHCNGTGTIRSTESTALVVLRALEDEGIRRRSAEVTIHVPTQIALYVLNQKRLALGLIEQRYGFHVTVAQDDALIPPAFRLERVRALTPAELSALPVPALPPLAEDEEEEAFVDEEALPLEADEGEAPTAGDAGEARPDAARRKRRRRKRRHGGPEDHAPSAAPDTEGNGEPADGGEEAEGEGSEAGEDARPDDVEAASDPASAEAERKRRRRGKRGGRRRRREDETPVGTESAASPVEEAAEPFAEEYPSVLDYARDGREHLFDADEAVTTAPAAEAQPETAAEAAPADAAAAAAPPEEIKPKRRRAPRKKAEADAAASTENIAPVEAVGEPVAPIEIAVAETAVPDAAPVKRRRTRKAATEQAAPPPETPAESAPVVAVDPAPVEVAAPESDLPVAVSVPPADDAPVLEPVADLDPNRPRKTGWWQRLIP